MYNLPESSKCGENQLILSVIFSDLTFLPPTSDKNKMKQNKETNKNKNNCFLGTQSFYFLESDVGWGTRAT